MLDSSGNNITQMPREIGGTEYNLPEKEAYINTYLNSTWLNTLSTDVQSKIVTHIFNVGLVQSDETSLLNTVAQEQTYKWQGKVGLMNASDYVKASTNSACTSVSANMSNSSCYNNSQVHNWIYKIVGSGLPAWTSSPFSQSVAATNFIVTSGILNCYGAAEFLYYVFPIFYLSSNITLIGEGTSSSPYVVG